MGLHGDSGDERVFLRQRANRGSDSIKAVCKAWHSTSFIDKARAIRTHVAIHPRAIAMPGQTQCGASRSQQNRAELRLSLFSPLTLLRLTRYFKRSVVKPFGEDPKRCDARKPKPSSVAISRDLSKMEF
jgi:hypothetical protein